MQATARQKNQQNLANKAVLSQDELLARKAKKEELRKKRLKRASFFWLSICAYFGLIILLAFFIYKATGISDMFKKLNDDRTLVAGQERPLRGVVQKTKKHTPEPTSEKTAVVEPPVPNVVILQHSGRKEGVLYRISGQLQNIGTAPAIDVMVTAIFYDAKGDPVGRDTDHVWRKVSSLEPNQKFEFTNILPSTESSRVAKYDLTVKWY